MLPDIPEEICGRSREKANLTEVMPGVIGYYCPHCGNTWLPLPSFGPDDEKEIEDQQSRGGLQLD